MKIKSINTEESFNTLTKVKGNIFNPFFCFFLLFGKSLNKNNDN